MKHIIQTQMAILVPQANHQNDSCVFFVVVFLTTGTGKLGTYVVHLHLVNLVHETESSVHPKRCGLPLVGAGGFWVLFRAGSGDRTESAVPAVRLPGQHGL